VRRPILLLIAAVLTVVVVGGVVLALDPFTDEPAPDREKPYATTPLEGFETTTLTVPRAAFCGAVDEREVTAALGDGGELRGYENGDEVALADGLTDVAHEFGCVWSAADGSEARAWVFAPPVDAERAREMVDEARRTKGCESSPTPSYGSPSVGLICTGVGGTRASYRGLFGDAWLTCELTSPDPAADTVELRARTGAWCVGVAKGASA
jgi:hypothetical protein